MQNLNQADIYILNISIMAKSVKSLVSLVPINSFKVNAINRSIKF